MKKITYKSINAYKKMNILISLIEDTLDRLAQIFYLVPPINRQDQRYFTFHALTVFLFNLLYLISIEK